MNSEGLRLPSSLKRQPPKRHRKSWTIASAARRATGVASHRRNPMESCSAPRRAPSPITAFMKMRCVSSRDAARHEAGSAATSAAILKEHHAGATFLFNLGPDRTGRALGSLPRVPRLRCYGLAALLSGTLLPAPDVGMRCAEVMRSVRTDGHEAGILAYDRASWVRHIGAADEAWTAAAMRHARECYEDIFKTPALTHGAPAWRMNRYAYRYAQRLAFLHCSDTRGTGPFIPVVRGRIVSCPQLPPPCPLSMSCSLAASIPTKRCSACSTQEPRAGADRSCYALRAESKGRVCARALRALLAGWRAMGTRGFIARLRGRARPVAAATDEYRRGTVAGASGPWRCRVRNFWRNLHHSLDRSP